MCEESTAARAAASGSTASCCAAAATAATATATASACTAARPLTEDEIFQRKTLEQLNAEKPLGDIAFDYDMSTLRDDARATLQRNADYMRRWPSIKVTIEGHADARGTNEYNLALGERRGGLGEGLPGQPGDWRGSDARDQQG